MSSNLLSSSRASPRWSSCASASDKPNELCVALLILVSVAPRSIEWRFRMHSIHFRIAMVHASCTQFICMTQQGLPCGVNTMEPHAPLFPSFMTPLSDLYGANGFRVGESYAYTQDLDDLDREELAFEQTVRALVDRPAPTPTGVKFHRPHGSGMATPSTTAAYPTQYQASGSMMHGHGFGERHQDDEEDEDDEDDMEEDDGDDMDEIAEEEITAEDDDEELFPEDDEEDQEEDGSMDLSMDMDD